jgi:sec-independent protein translocase protein TatA
MFNIGFQELLIILMAALLLFGGRRLPELARSLGNGLREFRAAVGDIKRDVQDSSAPAARPADPAPLPKPGEPVPPAKPDTSPAPEDAAPRPGVGEPPKA